MKNADQPITPIYYTTGTLIGEGDDPFLNGTKPMKGLTKREYFAAMAMQGMLANPERNPVFDSCRTLVTASINHADELLKQLEE